MTFNSLSKSNFVLAQKLSEMGLRMAQIVKHLQPSLIVYVVESVHHLYSCIIFADLVSAVEENIHYVAKGLWTCDHYTSIWVFPILLQVGSTWLIRMW